MVKAILIIDDAEDIKEMISSVLENAGYNVVTATDGTDALNKLRRLHNVKIEMVITDLNMPLMNGIEFIKKLRETFAHRFTPVILMTSGLKESKKQEAKQAGVSGWINKPFTPRQLRDIVKKFVNP